MGTYEPSIGDVIRSAIRDAQDLVRSELALAKAEVREEIRRASVGAGLLAGAALAAVMAVIFLMTTVALAIAVLLGWPVWSGFGIVTMLVALAIWLGATLSALAWIGASSHRLSSDHSTCLPVSSGAMMCSQTCGLVHSNSLTVPALVMVLSGSNIAKE